jgi:hypothetical protein
MGQQRLRRQQLQLDRQRQAIQSHADRGDCASVLVCHHEGGLDIPQPLDEQLDRCVVGQALGRGQLLEVGQRQRRHRDLLFAAQVQRHAAGDKRLHTRRCRQHIGNQRRRSEDLLEVVEQQQQLPLTQRRLERHLDCLTTDLAHAQRLGNSGDYQAWVADRRQVDKTNTICEGVINLGGDLQRQPSLAGAAGAGQGHQPHLGAAQ